MKKEGLSAIVGMLILWGVGLCSLLVFPQDPSAEKCVLQSSAGASQSPVGAWHAVQDRSGKHTVFVRQWTRVRTSCHHAGRVTGVG